jgi:hypothetical protein
MANTISSNSTGLRYAEEVIGTPGTLPGSPVWNPLEPNSYGEFGPQVKTVARNPINASRQRRKGVVTDLDAAAGFNSDFTQKTFYDLMQGFMFADWREKPELAVTSVDATTGFGVASGGAAFIVGSIVFGQGFGVAANNGIKVVNAASGTAVDAPGTATEASPPADAKITMVGFEGASADITLTVSGGVATLGCTAADFTDYGLIPGEWIWVGGDATANKFATAANNGFYRIKTISATAIVFDRTPNSPVTDTGTGKTIRVFFGHVIKNESDPDLIVMRTYQLERSLAAGGNEYVLGCAANTLAFDIKTADKITVDLSFVGMDGETTDNGSEKAGTRPNLPKSNYAFNSSADFTRLRLLDDTGGGSSLATYLSDLKLSIDNGITPAKAISQLGAIDLTTGDFMVSGTVEAYFATTDAITAVRENDDVSLDFALVAKNVGWLFDIPLITLGDARLKVEKDKPIILPLSLDAAAHETLDHTMLVGYYAYLPNAAQ